MQPSRTAIFLNAFVGLVLFGFIMYPVLSSAQGLRERTMMRKDDMMERMQTMRMERSEKLEEKRGEWKQRFGKLTDERKAKLAEQLAGQMNSLNERLCNQYEAFLDRLMAILGKIETRMAELTGKDTSSVKAKIDAAKVKIENTKNAVLVQEGKIYDVSFTGEDKVRDAFQSVKKQMQADHEEMRKQVGEAKKAVQDAFAALKTLVTE